MTAGALALLVAIASQEFPVELPPPAGVDAANPAKLLVFCGGKEIPVQVAGGKLVFLAPEKPGIHQVQAGTPKEFPKVDVANVEGKHLLVSYGGKKILQYNAGVVKPLEGVDPVFERSGHIHPIWTPSGKVITNDMPKNHLHHHGLWAAWTSSEFEGRKSNFWESGEKQGKIECVKVEETFSGPVFGGFRARHSWLNLNGPDGPKAALEEVWDVRVYATSGRFVFDVTSTQTCAGAPPLVIKEYRYGGIGFRGPADWEGKEGCAFLTSEGKTRKDGHATKASWCLMSGRIGDGVSSIAFVNHPSNFRYPQPMRIHPDEPFFNWAVPQGGDFSIVPGKPYVARYRFVVSDGLPAESELNGHLQAYSEPKVMLIAGR